MKDKVTIICITAIICVAILAFPYYYKTFSAADEAPADESAQETKACAVQLGSRYTSLWEVGTRNKVIVDQETGWLYGLSFEVQSGEPSFTLKRIAKLGGTG